MPRSRSFTSDGGPATCLGTCILAVLVTVCTLGICYRWGMVMRYRWRTEHTYVGGHRHTSGYLPSIDPVRLP